MSAVAADQAHLMELIERQTRFYEGKTLEEIVAWAKELDERYIRAQFRATLLYGDPRTTDQELAEVQQEMREVECVAEEAGFACEDLTYVALTGREGEVPF